MALNLDERLGVCSWSLQPKSPAELAESVRACGLRFVQLALNPLHDEPGVWGDAAQVLADAGVAVHSGMFGCEGEDYSTLHTIRATGGLVPDAMWPQNQQIIEAAQRSAEGLGLRLVTTHAGFVPEPSEAEAFVKIVERVQWAADRFQASGMTLLLETGQESAEALETFLQAVDRPNVGVNFDPANMILYDKGDPVAALRRLLPYLGQVHIKDAVRAETPGEWGREVPVGAGDVDWPAFLEVLDESSFDGDLVIEREAGRSRLDDIRAARQLLNDWLTEEM